MDNLDILYLGLFVICLLFSGFFSSTETAFMSLQKIRLKHMERTGVEKADRVAKILSKPERFLTSILTGNNLVNTACATLATAIAVSLLGQDKENTAVFVATMGVTLLLLVFGEVIPKNYAAKHSQGVALFYARPVSLIMWLLTPSTAILNWMGTGVAKLAQGSADPETVVTEEEIRTMISVGMEEGVVEEEEAEMLHNIFEFGDSPVHEVMTPRPDIVWIEEGTRLRGFLEIYAKAPHSRFPVYKEHTDNVIGVVSIKDVLMAQAQRSIDDNDPLDDLVRPILYVPTSKPIGSTFAEMQSNDTRIAAVVDEFGSVDGIVTLEQLLEEIVGSIGDELGGDTKEFETIDERTFIVDGGMRVEEANEELGLNMPEGEYETVAGFVLARLGRIPEEGVQFKHGNLTLVVTRMRGMRIEKLRVTKEIISD